MRSKLIVCPYHQWSYALDSDFKATSSMREAPDFDKSDYPLRRAVAVREWRGAIFVSLADDPPSLRIGLRTRRRPHRPLPSLEQGNAV